MNIHSTSLLAPSSPDKTRNRNEGCNPVEQDGFTSANVGNKTTQGACFFFCLDAGLTDVDKMTASSKLLFNGHRVIAM